MSERWRRWKDKKGEEGFVFHPWMKTVDDLEDQIAHLLAVLDGIAQQKLTAELIESVSIHEERPLTYDDMVMLAREAIAKAESDQ